VRSSTPRLTALGGVAVALGAGLFGAVIDVMTGPGLRTVFAVFFVIGCVTAAAMVRRHDLLAAVVLPPLVYLAIALVAAGIEISGTAGSWLTRETLEASTSLVLHAPTLIIATALAAIVAGVRAVGTRGRISNHVPAARVPGHGAH
jgi:hypothetical protein